MIIRKHIWPIIAGLLPLTPVYGQTTPWKIEMRQVRLPTVEGDCGPIELVVRDAEGKTPVTPDGKQIDWQDFDVVLTQGAGPLRLIRDGRFLCATAPGAKGVITARYPESTYLKGNGRGRTGKQLIPGATASATLEVMSAGAPTAAGSGLEPPPPNRGTPTVLSPAPAAGTTSSASSAVTGVSITQGSTGPLVTWNPIAGASYSVSRWKIDDPACCNSMSPPNPALSVPRWQDTALPMSGTYVYRVTAMTPAGVAYTDAQFNYGAPVAPVPAPPPAAPVPAPTVVAATGLEPPPPNRGTPTVLAPAPATNVSAGTTLGMGIEPPPPISSPSIQTPTPTTSAPTGTTAPGVPSTDSVPLTRAGLPRTTTITSVLQSINCSVPVESITAVSGLALASTSGGVSLNWTPIQCPSMTYRKVTVGVKDGQTIQSASAIQPSVDSATGRLYTTDTPSAAGLSSANYRIDATLPDGRTVSSQWVTWTSPAAQAAASSQSGRYRIVIKGIRVSNNTIDNVMQSDGKYDEVYVAAHTNLYDIRNGSLQNHAILQSRIHGDIGNGTVFPTRIKAGSASPEGGLRGNVKANPPAWDLVPGSLNPAGAPAQGTLDRLPLTVWTGELRDGIDALVIAPSIWESDLDDKTFREYAAGAQRMSTEFFTALKVPELTTQALPTVSQADITMGVSTTPDAGTLLGSFLTGAFFVGSTALSSNVDRPIGLMGVIGGVGQQLLFKDSFVVVTRAMAEKALSTQPPSPGALPPSVIAITYTDTPNFPGLEGQYILYLEIQRDSVPTASPSTISGTTTSPGITTPTSTSTGSTAPQSGQYRVVVKGVRVQHHTTDHVLQIDGKYDEIYVAAQVSKFNLRTAELLQHGTGRSRVHGDIGDGTPFPTRVRAGTASPQGGLRGDDTSMPPVADLVPANLNPGGPPAQGLTDQLPFIAWEGTLTSGEDAIVIAPSIWEWDGDETPFKQYVEIGKTAAIPMFVILNVPLVAASPTIEVTQTVVANTTTGTLGLAVPTTQELALSLATSGIYSISKAFLGTGPDRLIGVDGAVAVGSAGSGVIYRDRFIILTRDKIERALSTRPAVPSALPLSVIPIEFFDTELAMDLKGKYVMYLEVQRQ